MSTLVTGDAVVLELPPANLGSRLVGFLIDLICWVGLLLLLFFALVEGVFALDDAAATATFLVMVVTILVILPAAFEAFTRGRSPGKYALGLRVVRDDGGPVRLRQTLARALVGFGEVYLLFGMASVPAVLVTQRCKRLGDMLAGTYVVSERTSQAREPMSEMPAHLAGWARQADIAAVPGRLSLAARSFLARLDTLSPQARTELGRELATDLLALVAPAPPAGTQAEDVIAAVLAERRRRDLERIQRDEATLDRLRSMAEHARGI